MTEQQIKEFLSRHFVGLIASRRGFKLDGPNPDHGTDFIVSRAVYQNRPRGRRLADDTLFLVLQLKCTCVSSTYPDGDAFKYDLEVDAYNDLVDCWSNGKYNKRLLVLLVLPDEKDQWLTVGVDQLVIRRTAYWYHPEPSCKMTANKDTIRIRIPYANAVTLDLLDDKFAEYYT